MPYRTSEESLTPSCYETYGAGWHGDSPNCTYNPDPTQGMQDFTGEIDDLGYGDILEGSTWEEDYEKFFDTYDYEKERMLTRASGIDIDQLGTAWDLSKKQLGETWGLKAGELGWGAGLGLGKARRAGIGAKRKSGLAFSGTAEGMQKTAERDVMGKYRSGLKAGKSAYEQAIEAGELKLSQATTDIYQGLEEDVYDAREVWADQQRATLNVLLGSGIWPEDDDIDDDGSNLLEDDPTCVDECMSQGNTYSDCNETCLCGYPGCL